MGFVSFTIIFHTKMISYQMKLNFQGIYHIDAWSAVQKSAFEEQDRLFIRPEIIMYAPLDKDDFNLSNSSHFKTLRELPRRRSYFHLDIIIDFMFLSFKIMLWKKVWLDTISIHPSIFIHFSLDLYETL